MIKIRKKILAVLLTAAMLVSMSSLVAWSDEQPATDDGTSQTEQTTDDGASADDKQDDKKDDKKDDKEKPRTDEEGLAEMSVVAENDSYKLYFNESTTTMYGGLLLLTQTRTKMPRLRRRRICSLRYM